MKRFACVTLLAFACVVPVVAQDSGAARSQKESGQTAVKADKQKVKEGQDCDPNKAGVRCSRPKPKKVWFWGKA